MGALVLLTLLNELGKRELFKNTNVRFYLSDDIKITLKSRF